MFGVIYRWRVLADRQQEFATVMREILRIERERHPLVLANLTFGPAVDGTHAEVQVFRDAAANEAFLAGASDDAELSGLWGRLDPLCVPGSQESQAFAALDFLDGSFVRDESGLR